MSSSRNQILDNIRRGLNRDALEGESLEKVKHRLAYHPNNSIPARSKLPQPEQVKLFEDMATEASAELHKLKQHADLPQAIAEFMNHEGLNHLVSATSTELTSLDWTPLESCKIEHREAQAGDAVSLTSSFAGIAETGTLMLLSGAHSPTTLNFLPDIHLVVLDSKNIVGPYEDAWQKLRETHSEMPRTVNMITGPSRSADIEQKLQMGAHGPKRLVIFMIEN